MIFLLYSSSKLLSREIATTLRGRAIATEIFPFNFRETLLCENPEVRFPAHPGAQTRAFMVNRFWQFLIRERFPEVQSLSEYYRIRVLQEYVDIVILRDVIERHVALNVTDQTTRARKINALELAMQECGLKQAYLITLEQRETVKLKVGTIEIMPAWYWTLYVLKEKG